MNKPAMNSAATIVLIDAGNTRVKLGWVQAGSGRREAGALALPHSGLEQIQDWLRQLPSAPAAALGVNVAGRAIGSLLAEQLAPHTGITWVDSQRRALNVHNGYETPAQLGADRWVALLGLAARMPAAQGGPPLMLASFGTATTIDTLVSGDPDGGGHAYVFRGGLILPGPALMASSLAGATAHLPQAEGVSALYPTHTHQAIATGIGAAQAGAVLRQWMAALDMYGEAPRIYAAGGGWPSVQEETRRLLRAARARLGLPDTPIEWLAGPVLDGLASLAPTLHLL